MVGFLVQSEQSRTERPEDPGDTSTLIALTIPNSPLLTVEFLGTRPEIGGQHQLPPQKGPAEDVLSVAAEEVASDPVLHCSHQISHVHIH